MITAREAKYISEKYYEDETDMSLSWLYKDIDEAAHAGKSHIILSIDKTLTHRQKNRLISIGYDVKITRVEHSVCTAAFGGLEDIIKEETMIDWSK